MPTNPLIKPLLQDDAFLGDVAQTQTGDGRLHLWWLGQSGFLLQWQGQHLLFDPYLSDSLTRKYAGTDKPHVRMTERVIAPEQLDFVQVVTSSHLHTDHLDPETIGPLLQVNPDLQLVIPEANRQAVAQRLQIPAHLPFGLDAGQSIRAAAFRIHALPAAHNALERDDLGRFTCLGYVVEAGPWTLYHSGDTLRYPGMEDLLRRWTIDVAILPINGNLPERRVAGNLNGSQAAQLAGDIQARLVVPCHYEMFEFNTASPDEFVAACRTLQQPYHLLRCGERWSSPEPEG